MLKVKNCVHGTQLSGPGFKVILSSTHVLDALTLTLSDEFKLPIIRFVIDFYFGDVVRHHRRSSRTRRVFEKICSGVIRHNRIFLFHSERELRHDLDLLSSELTITVEALQLSHCHRAVLSSLLFHTWNSHFFPYGENLRPKTIRGPLVPSGASRSGLLEEMNQPTINEAGHD